MFGPGFISKGDSKIYYPCESLLFDAIGGMNGW